MNETFIHYLVNTDSQEFVTVKPYFLSSAEAAILNYALALNGTSKKYISTNQISS